MKNYTEIMSRLKAYQFADRRPEGLEAVEEFESKMGIRLPPDYRDFVSVWGISSFRGKVAFSIHGNPPFGGEGLVGVFLGLKPGDSYDLTDAVELYTGRLPEGLIPVIEDPGSNMVCLTASGSEYGHVSFWDKESEGLSDGVWPIADSWDEFMNSLRPWTRAR